MPGPNTNTFAPAPAAHGAPPRIRQPEPGSRVIVVGAGAFGGWAALSLLQKKFRVTLIDAWGPGNARSSSGDESRVIRSTYGANSTYFDLNVRALELWKGFQQTTGRPLFFNTGVLWLCHDEKTPVVDASMPFARAHNQPYQYLSKKELTDRYPLIAPGNLHHAYLDPYGGYLKAREACIAVKEAFVRQGGKYIESHVTPGAVRAGKMENIRLSNGATPQADVYVFACGAWLGTLFPAILGRTVTSSRQEVYYFGVPPHHAGAFGRLPVWVDADGRDFYYGIPAHTDRGFKVGVDRRGKAFDPTHDDRLADPGVLAHARQFLAHRFPSLRNAPLLEHRVCAYENSPDGNFVFDAHPEAPNVLFLGGGSGHGFKHGPALGEMVADVLTGRKQAPHIFSLNRFGGGH